MTPRLAGSLYLAASALWLVSISGPALLDHDARLILGWAWLTAALAFGATFSRYWGRPLSVRDVVGGAALLQLLAVLLLWPALSEDALRYRADGNAWLAGRSPYASTPAALAASGAVVSDPLLPHQGVHALYLPTSQALFIGVAGVERALIAPAPNREHPGAWRGALASMTWAQRVGLWKVVFGAAAVGATWLLALALVRRGSSPTAAVLFGWHPLVVVESGGMAHQDAFGALIVIGAAAALEGGRAYAAGGLSALAMMVKPAGAALWLFDLAKRAPGSGRSTVAALFVGAVGATLLLPELGFVGFFQTVERFSGHWEANGSVYAVVRALGPADGSGAVWVKRVYRWGAALFLLGAAARLVRQRAPTIDAGGWLLTLSLLIAPVVYPWYLIWPLALAPLATRLPVVLLTWSATVPLAYTLWRTPDWALPWSAWLAEYLPVALVIAYWATRRRQNGTPM